MFRRTKRDDLLDVAESSSDLSDELSSDLSDWADSADGDASGATDNWEATSGAVDEGDEVADLALDVLNNIVGDVVDGADGAGDAGNGGVCCARSVSKSYQTELGWSMVYRILTQVAGDGGDLLEETLDGRDDLLDLTLLRRGGWGSESADEEGWQGQHGRERLHFR